MPDSLPPFKQGGVAFRENKPITDNPYPEGVAQGDDYPGPHVNWRDGWNFEKKIIEHSKAG